MKKLLIGFAALAVIVIAIVLVLPAVLPLDTFKEEITQQAKAATGRDLAIDGEMSVSIVPNVAVTAKGVRFANAPGGSAPDMATLDALRVKVQLLPLLGGEIAVDEFILVKPEILLEVDEQGRPNWEFGDGGAAAQAGTADSSQASDASGGGGLPDLRLGDVRIVDGKITYIDRAAGTREEVTDLDLELTLPDMDSRFRAAGDFGLRGREIAAELEAASLGQLMGGTATAVKAAVTSDLVTLSFDGEVTQAAAATVGGTIDLDVPSLQELIAFASPEAPMQASEGTFGLFRVDGKLDMVGEKISFQDAEIALDQLVARGNMQFDGSGQVPRITASISTDLLDVTPYLGGAEGGEEGGGQASDGGGGQASGWSDEPIDLSGLRAANADISIATAGLKVNDIEIGKSALAILLESGRLTAKLTEMQLYGGNGSGEVIADGSGEGAAIAAKFDLTGVEAEPILIDAANMDRLSGTLESNFDIRGSGISQKALVSALNGSGAFKFTDGAVKGVNIAAMFRNISLEAIKGSFAEAEKTDFAELTGTFQITNGILRNSDLLMLAPILRMTGEGEVPLPSRTIDYLIKPKLVGTLEGQGGNTAAKGLTIPVRISGSWDDPSYQPDMEAILKEQIGDPGKLVDGVKGAAEGQAGSVKDAVKDIGKSDDASLRPSSLRSCSTEPEPAPQTSLALESSARLIRPMARSALV